MVKIKTPKPFNPLIHCRFCNKEMKGKSLSGHIKRLHANDPSLALNPDRPDSSLPDGRVEVIGQELSEKLKRYFVDENGFLVSVDVIPEAKYIENTNAIYDPKKIRRRLAKQKKRDSGESKNA